MDRSSALTTAWPGLARVQELGQVLRPIWLLAVLVIIGAWVLQGAQAMVALVDVADAGFWSCAHFSLLAAVVILALCAWYFARALLVVRFWFTPQERPYFASWRRWASRLLGLLVPLAIAASYLRYCFLYLEQGAYGIVEQLGFGVFYLGGAVYLLLFFRQRQRLLGNQTLGAPQTEELRDSSFITMSGILALCYLLLILFLISKVVLPQWLGALAVLLYAIVFWSAFGSLVLAYPSYRFSGPPLVLVALLLLVVFSPFNGNHGIRYYETRTAVNGAEALTRDRPPVVRFFRDAWLPDRLAAWRSRFPEDSDPPPYPVVLVAAEGGGIRAAYWTAAVLGKLEDEVPGFSCHVFALSGVSGGNLGSAVYAALQADQVDAGQPVCPGGSGEVGTGSLQQAAGEVLSQDFLAPTLAGMLFPDLAQRFLPISVLPDRADYLERSWEEGWRRGSRSDAMGSDRFEEDFRDLWSCEKNELVPSLFFNATWVSGGRLVASNLRPDDSFVAVDDIVEILGRPVRLSTAVHLSARFPYVSPAVSLWHDGQRRSIVDGGFFENSGTLTAAEILAALGPPEGNFLPVVLIVTNLDRGTAGPPGLLPQVLSPVETLLNTRLTRGYLAEETLEAAARGGGSPVFKFRLSHSSEAPLGLGSVAPLAPSDRLSVG